MCSVIAYLLYNSAIAMIGTNRSSVFAGVATVVSVTAGVIFLREPYTIYQSSGTLLVIAGVYLANRVAEKKPAVEPSPAASR